MKQNTSACPGKIAQIYMSLCLFASLMLKNKELKNEGLIIKIIIIIIFFSDPNMVSPTTLFHPPSKYTQLQTTTPLGPKPILFTPSVHSPHVS